MCGLLGGSFVECPSGMLMMDLFALLDLDRASLSLPLAAKG